MEQEFQLRCWRVNPSEGTISDHSEVRRLEPKALSVLISLAKADGQVVSRNELLDQVWPNQVVGDDVINSSIAALRKALGDNRKTNLYIQTVPKKGYMLVESVRWYHQQTSNSNSVLESSKFVENRIGTERRGRNNVALKLMFILSVLLIAFALYQFSNDPQQSEPLLVDNSIAILPFDVYSQNPEMSFFADGLVEEMLHQLTASPQLKVIARSASFQYRNSSKELTTIASELSAKYLIEGSIREYNNQLKITVQLIDAKNNYQLWSRVFDEESTDLFKIQQHVGVAVDNMLSINEPQNSWNTQRKHPQSDEAYKYFVMAQAHLKAANAESYKDAELLLNKAIAIAPEYGLAYTSLAISHLLQYQYNHTSLDLEVGKASAALDKALELEPDQPEALAAMGLMYTYTDQPVKAEKAFLRAIELKPKLRIAHHNFAFLLWRQARYAQAIEHLEFALEADPLAKPTNFLMGDSLGRMAYFDRAIKHYKLCQKVLPEYVWCYSGIADIYRITGNITQAKVNMQRSAGLSDTGDFWRANSHASLLIYQGELDKASQMLEQVKQKTGATYPLLKNRFLIAMAQGEVSKFSQRVDLLFEEVPDNLTVRKFKALSAYWNGDYQTSIDIYETILKENPTIMFQLWDYADGISHPINLAVAYEKLGMQKKKQQLLMRIERHLSSFSERLEKVPGCIYIQAQYEYLIGNIDSSQKKLARIEKSWAINWIIDKDIFWKNMATSDL